MPQYEIAFLGTVIVEVPNADSGEHTSLFNDYLRKNNITCRGYFVVDEVTPAMDEEMDGVITKESL